MSRKKTQKKTRPARVKARTAEKARPGKPGPRKRTPPPGRKRIRPSPARSAPSAVPAASMRDRAVASMTFARGITRDLIKAFRDEHRSFQATPTDNHLLWTLGHLAQSFDWFAGLIDGKPSQVPQAYQQLFGFKSLPGAPQLYPPFEEICEQFDRTFERFMAAVAALAETDLLLPTAGESFGFAKDRLEVVERAAWHEGWHAGQLSSLRRALGLPPIMG